MKTETAVFHKNKFDHAISLSFVLFVSRRGAEEEKNGLLDSLSSLRTMRSLRLISSFALV